MFLVNIAHYYLSNDKLYAADKMLLLLCQQLSLLFLFADLRNNFQLIISNNYYLINYYIDLIQIRTTFYFNKHSIEKVVCHRDRIL